MKSLILIVALMGFGAVNAQEALPPNPTPTSPGEVQPALPKKKLKKQVNGPGKSLPKVKDVEPPPAKK